MPNEPIKHHYIPQFIISKFCEDDSGFLWYYNRSNGEMSHRHKSEIFMARNLYRDEINNPDNPTKIEHDLAVFEHEVSEIINKFNNEDDITISYDDSEKVKFFFALMAFRSISTSRLFNNRLSKESKDYYSFYQEDGNMTDFWKRNLGLLVNCRSIVEVLDNPDIDEPIKKFMVRDTFGVFGLYLAIAERRGSEDFFLSDTYPLTFDGATDDGIKVLMYHIIPISPKRVVIIAAKGIIAMPQSERIFSDDVLKEPRIMNGLVKLHVKKLYQKEVESINSEISKHYKEAAFLDKDRFVIRDD